MVVCTETKLNCGPPIKFGRLHPGLPSSFHPTPIPEFTEISGNLSCLSAYALPCEAPSPVSGRAATGNYFQQASCQDGAPSAAGSSWRECRQCRRSLVSLPNNEFIIFAYR